MQQQTGYRVNMTLPNTKPEAAPDAILELRREAERLMGGPVAAKKPTTRFSSRAPRWPFRVAQFLLKSSKGGAWAACELDTQHGALYKRLHKIVDDNGFRLAQTYALRLPAINARIKELKAARGRSMRPYKRSKIDSELSQLRSLSRSHQLALEWVNSGSPIVVYMIDRFGPKFSEWIAANIVHSACRLYL